MTITTLRKINTEKEHRFVLKLKKNKISALKITENSKHTTFKRDFSNCKCKIIRKKWLKNETRFGRNEILSRAMAKKNK